MKVCLGNTKSGWNFFVVVVDDDGEVVGGVRVDGLQAAMETIAAVKRGEQQHLRADSIFVGEELPKFQFVGTVEEWEAYSENARKVEAGRRERLSSKLGQGWMAALGFSNEESQVQDVIELERRVVRAIESGASLKTIADWLGVSRSRARQIAVSGRRRSKERTPIERFLQQSSLIDLAKSQIGSRLSEIDRAISNLRAERSPLVNALSSERGTLEMYKSLTKQVGCGAIIDAALEER